MDKKPGHPPHFIREWRNHRGYSLRKLAERMEYEPGKELLSHASLGRIERGVQPYTQESLQALAVALDVEPWELLKVNPLVEGEVVDLMRQLRSLDQEKRTQAVAVLKALAG